MAAPADRTIQDLSGDWVMERNLSDNTDEILKLQGVGWVTRKAISVATITVKINQYPDSQNPKSLHVDSDQVLTGGIKGTSETRIADGVERPHKDHIFGSLSGKSWIGRGERVAGAGADERRVVPKFELKTRIGDEKEDAKVRAFLRGEVLADGKPSKGFLVDEGVGEGFGDGEGLFLQSWVVNQDSGYGWTAEQIWGFEDINGQRRHTRRVAVAAKGGKYILARLVYDFIGPRT